MIEAWLAFKALPKWAHGALLIAAGFTAFLIWDHFDDRAAVKQAEAKREAKAQPARDKAAEERVTDAARNAAQQENYREAIEAAPGGELSPAARALACQRLRNIGRIPPACRPEGGDGNEAPAD